MPLADATFSNAAGFSDTTFADDTSFENAEFSFSADFHGVTFSGETTFKKVAFGFFVSITDAKQWGSPAPVFDWDKDITKKPDRLEPQDWPPGIVPATDPVE